MSTISNNEQRPLSRFTDWKDSDDYKAFMADPAYEKRRTAFRNQFWNETLSFHVEKLRNLLGFSQAQLAKAINISQPGICQRLKKPKNIANLADLIEAMGGDLDVVAYINGRAISLTNGLVLPFDPDEHICQAIDSNSYFYEDDEDVEQISQ
jgi:transcriptional regulator with XRE-family HTH domain